MVVTIYDGYDGSCCSMSLTVGSFDCRDAWRKRYCGDIVLKPKDLLKKMLEVSSWANNDLCEECMFDVE